MKIRLLLWVSFIILNSVFCSQTDPTETVKDPDVPKSVEILKDIEYAQADGKSLLLDLYVNKSVDAKTPLVVWIHGGAWLHGSKENPKHALRLLDEGFSVASVNYRLSGEASFPAQIIDCKAAIRWLRKHADEHNIDGSKFGVWGSSAGGHLVALLGTSGEVKDWDIGDNTDGSSKVQAVCDWYGPTDFLRMDDVEGMPLHIIDGSPETALIGGDLRENADKVALANPITHIHSGCPPFLIMHGKVDSTVIHQQSILLYDALKAKDLRAELVLLDDMGHGGKGWSEQVPRVAAFFKKVIGTRE